jgi:hypothetical protein
MKKIALFFSFVLSGSIATVIQAQQTISIKGTSYTIAGESAGKISGNGAAANTYECFLDVNKEDKTFTCTTVQTIGTGDNNKDVVVKTVALSALKIEFWDEDPDTDNNMFPQPVYKVVLQTKDYNKVVSVKANYRYMPDGEMAEQDNVYEILVLFKEKADGTAFIKLLNGFK